MAENLLTQLGKKVASKIKPLEARATSVEARVTEAEKSGGSDYMQSNSWNINLPNKQKLMASPTGCVVVGETTHYCAGTAGCYCSWTVPDGVTKAQFQIWGAGGNAAGCRGSCCTYGAAGGNGEYTFVEMMVKAGDVYCLCAGGAYGAGSCYSYSNYNGCNSSVCGSNNTCILSCGGSCSYGAMCGNVRRDLYPGASQIWTGDAGIMVGTNETKCDDFFNKPVNFRYGGLCTGGITSNNIITSSAKVPSYSGGVNQCGCSGLCYMRNEAVAIDCNHNLEHIKGAWGGGTGCNGCAYDSCATWNKPGLGGPAVRNPCSINTYYGGRGRSGLVIVKYK